MRRFALTIGVLLAAVHATAASEDARPAFAELLPPDTLALIEAPDVPALSAALAASPLARLWDEPSVVEFLAPMRARLGSMEAEYSKRGLPLREWAKGLRGRVGLAVVNLDLTREVPYPDLILLVDGGGALSGPLEAFVTRGARADDDEVNAGFREHRGARIRTLRRGALRVDIATVGDTLLVGTVSASVDRVLDAMDGRAGRSLAATAAYRTATDGLPGDLVRAFLHPPAMHAALANFLFPYEGWLKESGVLDVSGVALALEATEGGFSETIRIAVAPGSTKRGVFRLTRPSPWAEDIWRGVPRESFWVSATRVDPGGLWEEAFRIAKAVQPDAAAQLEEGRKQIDGYLGFRLREDLVETLEGTAVAYAAAGRGGRIIPDVVVRLDLADAPRLSKSIDEALKLAEETAPRESFRHEQRPYLGRVTHWIRVPDQPVIMSWCADGDRLWIALHPSTLRAALKRADETAAEEPSVLDHPGFARSVKGLDAHGGTFVWFDLPEAIRYLLAAARPILVSKIGSDNGWVDIALLPDGDEVAKAFGSLALTVQGDDGGVLIRSRSPAGLMAPLLVALSSGLVTATGMLSVVDPGLGLTPDERADADPTRGIDADLRNLDEIGAGLLIYSIDHEGRYPATLAELFTAEALPDPTVLLSPHDREPEKVGGLDCSYRYLGPDVGRVKRDRSDTIVAWSKHVPRAVLFLDGRVRRVRDDAAFEKLLAATRARAKDAKGAMGAKESK